MSVYHILIAMQHTFHLISIINVGHNFVVLCGVILNISSLHHSQVFLSLLLGQHSHTDIHLLVVHIKFKALGCQVSSFFLQNLRMSWKITVLLGFHR